ETGEPDPDRQRESGCRAPYQSVHFRFVPSGNVRLMLREPSLQDPLRFNRKTPPCAVVIFGANGDLTKRKLMPALYRLAFEGRLPASFAVLGNSRTPLSDDAFRDKMHEAVKRFLEDSPFDEDIWTSFARNLYFTAGVLHVP